jgi:hypothetical protein
MKDPLGHLISLIRQELLRRIYPKEQEEHIEEVKHDEQNRILHLMIQYG